MEKCNLKDGVELMVDPFRTIQIHPTRKCNLKCLHCYSSSSPNLNSMLDIDALKGFLKYAFDQGFNNISVSGGEPFLYNKLEELLLFTHNLGYQNTMATNGMLLRSEKNKRILEHVDLVAVSIDGDEPLHDYIRGQRGAFQKMLQGVEVLKSLNKPFGFIHTVTPQSWDLLLWLGEFAMEQGAKLLQLHPLEMYGRAIKELSSSNVDETLAHRIFILASYLRSKYQADMIVQLDLLHREYLEAFPQIVNTFKRQCAQSGRLSDILDTIIIEETGRILPFAYGFESNYTIGNIHNFSDTLFEAYLTKKVPILKNLFSETLNNILTNKEIDIVNWNEILVHESRYAV